MKGDQTAVVQLDRNVLRDLQQVFNLGTLPESPTLLDAAEVHRDLSDLDAEELSDLVAGAISLAGSHARVLLASKYS